MFDRSTAELEEAGYSPNKDKPGVRYYGTDGAYSSGWELMGTKIKLSDILLDCDALINVPILKQHGISGISFAMKNHYGTLDKPGQFHEPRMERAIAELNALAPIRERTRLIVGDALSIANSNWRSAIPGDSLLVGRDPVAIDAIALQLCKEALEAEGRNAAPAVSLSEPWLEHGAELGLGIADPARIDLVEVPVS